VPRRAVWPLRKIKNTKASAISGDASGFALLNGATSRPLGCTDYFESGSWVSCRLVRVNGATERQPIRGASGRTVHGVGLVACPPRPDLEVQFNRELLG
jgi:hypothetical protein